jgi:CheY-like chemotaxis protein
LPPSRRAWRAAPGAETILLVEDDPLVRKHTRDPALALGYQVIVGRGTPRRRMDRVQQDGVPDLLFTDIVCPAP